MVCHYTGEKITLAKSQIDHKEPLERGGSNDFENLCLCSPSANRAKGAMTEAEFKALLALVTSFPDGGRDVLRRLKASAFIYRG